MLRCQTRQDKDEGKGPDFSNIGHSTKKESKRQYKPEEITLFCNGPTLMLFLTGRVLEFKSYDSYFEEIVIFHMPEPDLKEEAQNSFLGHLSIFWCKTRGQEF